MVTLNADKVIQDIPRMRRYAALLCLGDRGRGDDLVEKALTDIVSKPSSLNGQNDYRLLLLRAIQQCVRKDLSLLPDQHDAASPASIDRHETGRDRLSPENAIDLLADMPVEQRSALLLVVVEGLSYDETAEILGTTTAIVKALLVDARGCLEAGKEPRSKSA